jgi:hypothetical protein
LAQIEPLFALGQIVATPAALKVLESTGTAPMSLVAKHAKGDWGETDKSDARLNSQAIKDGSRILSVYKLAGDVTVWIITDAADDDGKRQATTILLPEDY